MPKTIKLFFGSILVLFSSAVLANSPGLIKNGDDSTMVKSSERKVRIYNTVRLAGVKPKIDGHLNDDCWETGEWAGNFIQWIPAEGAKPSQPTIMKILYDDQNIYVAIRAYDNEPEKIQRKAGRRDEFIGDMVGVTFDSYFDHRTGFEFDMTAAGQKLDLLITNPMETDFNWNAVWLGESALEDSAWTAEMEIPLNQLRYSDDREQIWGLHCWRWIGRLQEESDWEPQSSTGPGILYLFGELHGISNLKKSRRIELMPYALSKLNTFQKQSGNPFAESGREFLWNAGLDAKFGISSNFTLDLTVNPDFGQVESDPSVMNLTAFETFYEEKRPFFLEGKNIFTYELDDASLFYSRRIGATPAFRPILADNEYSKLPGNTTILSAMKLSGKTSKGLAIGLLQSLTGPEKAQISSPAGDYTVPVEPFSGFTVARIQQDLNQSNTVIGGIFTASNRRIKDDHLNFLARNSYTGGLDLLHQWKNKEFFLEAKVISSFVSGDNDAIIKLQKSSARYFQRPDITGFSLDTTLSNLDGFGGNIRIGKGSKGLWRYSAGLSWFSPGLELNDIGYMKTADALKQTNNLSVFVNKPVSVFRTYSIAFSQFINWDYRWTYLSSGASLNIFLEFLNKWRVSSKSTYSSEALDTRLLRGGYAMKVPELWKSILTITTDQSDKLIFRVNLSGNISGNNRYKAMNINPVVSYRPVNTLKFSLITEYSRTLDELQYLSTQKAGNGSRYLFGMIDQKSLGFTFRTDFNITPEISVQYYGSPFASAGKYSRFKKITDPQAGDYNDRFELLNQVSGTDNILGMDENRDGTTDFSIRNPDFNFYQFRSNLVFRWEYKPGSQLFLVWSQDRTSYVNPGNLPVRKFSDKLAGIFPSNIFLFKISYWFPV